MTEQITDTEMWFEIEYTEHGNNDWYTNGNRQRNLSIQTGKQNTYNTGIGGGLMTEHIAGKETWYEIQLRLTDSQNWITAGRIDKIQQSVEATISEYVTESRKKADQLRAENGWILLPHDGLVYQYRLVRKVVTTLELK